MNNGFLRSVGIVQADKYRLTDIGGRLAAGLLMDSPNVLAGALRYVIQNSDVLNILLGMLAARREMTTNDFKTELMLLAGLQEDNRRMQFTKTIQDMFLEARLVQINENLITPLNANGEGEPAPGATLAATSQRPAQTQGSASSGSGSGQQTMEQGVPLALGPKKVAYLILPDGWDATKDLKKLLRLVELSLSEGQQE